SSPTTWLKVGVAGSYSRVWVQPGASWPAGAPGASVTGHCPVLGSDCEPARYGKKSTASELGPPAASISGLPLTGFSGWLGLVGGDTAGPPLAGDSPNSPHQLSSALTGVVVLAAEPSATRFSTP